VALLSAVALTILIVILWKVWMVIRAVGGVIDGVPVLSDLFHFIEFFKRRKKRSRRRKLFRV